MKLLALLFVALYALGSVEISEVRKSYIAAAKSEEKAMKFAALLESIEPENPNKTLVAYKGCALTLKAKHSGNLPDKISFMKEGARLIDAAAVADPQNIEIRVIRLSVQENVPFIVNYRQNKDEDKAFILENYAKTPKKLQPYILNYILQSESFSAQERKSLQ